MRASAASSRTLHGHVQLAEPSNLWRKWLDGLEPAKALQVAVRDSATLPTQVADTVETETLSLTPVAPARWLDSRRAWLVSERRTICFVATKSKARVADLSNSLLHLRVGHGPAQVERPVHRRTQFVRPKLDQPRQRTLAHSTGLRILRDLIIFGGARGRRDSGGRHPDNPARHRQRSREASSRLASVSRLNASMALLTARKKPRAFAR